MRTDELIARLSAEPATRGSPAAALAIGAAAAFGLALIAMVLTIGPRPDIASAAATWRFDVKLMAMLTLSGTAALLLTRAIYPEGLARAPLWTLLLAPALLAVMAGTEAVLLPRSAWWTAARGTNWAFCLVVVPSLGVLPLAALLWAIRQGATTRPALTGFLGGLLAGGAAATAYALHCPDDSPFFVILWYPIGILILASTGALLGSRLLRW